MRKQRSFQPRSGDNRVHDMSITGDLPRVIEENNTDRQTLACVLIDNSISTSRNGAIHEVNYGLNSLIDALQKDRIASRRVLVGAFTLGGGLRPISDGFVKAENFRAPKLMPTGDTPLGESLIKICDNIKTLKIACTEWGINTGAVQCLIITDGEPTDDQSVLHEASRAMVQSERSELARFHCFVVDGCNPKEVDHLFPRPSSGLSVADVLPMSRAFSSSL